MKLLRNASIPKLGSKSIGVAAASRRDGDGFANTKSFAPMDHFLAKVCQESRSLARRVVK